MYGKSNMETYIPICETDSQREFAYVLENSNRALYQPRGGMGREIKKKKHQLWFTCKQETLF